MNTLFDIESHSQTNDAFLIAVFICVHAVHVIGELTKNILPFNVQKPMTSETSYIVNANRS